MRTLFFSVLGILLYGCGPVAVGLIGGAESDGVYSFERRWFISASTYGPNLGGVDGADAKCNTIARNHGLTRTYRALLSAPGALALDRLSDERSIYAVLSSGEKVRLLNQLSDLFVGAGAPFLSDPEYRVGVDGEIINPTPNNIIVTGATANGALTTDHCNGWTDGGTLDGEFGSIASNNSNFFISSSSPTGCSALGTVTVRIVCISE